MTTPTGGTTRANGLVLTSGTVHTVVSILETVGFIVAAVLGILGHGSDAVNTALVSAVFHGVNHP